MLRLHNRQTIRKNGYDYTSEGWYFLTVCSFEREPIFEIGSVLVKIIEEEWFKLPNKFRNIGTDEFVVMPNHIHGIISISGLCENAVGASFMKLDDTLGISKCAEMVDCGGAINCAPTIGQIVRSFKASCSYRAHKEGVYLKIWQRNYYERVIRSEKELQNIRRYIRENPLNWESDEENL